MASAGKRPRPEKGFYKASVDVVPLERKKPVQKPTGKLEKEKFYPIEVCSGYLSAI